MRHLTNRVLHLAATSQATNENVLHPRTPPDGDRLTEETQVLDAHESRGFFRKLDVVSFSYSRLLCMTACSIESVSVTETFWHAFNCVESLKHFLGVKNIRRCCKLSRAVSVLPSPNLVRSSRPPRHSESLRSIAIGSAIMRQDTFALDKNGSHHYQCC